VEVNTGALSADRGEKEGNCDSLASTSPAQQEQCSNITGNITLHHCVMVFCTVSKCFPYCCSILLLIYNHVSSSGLSGPFKKYCIIHQE